VVFIIHGSKVAYCGRHMKMIFAAAVSISKCREAVDATASDYFETFDETKLMVHADDGVL
jgi:hypothetical protein